MDGTAFSIIGRHTEVFEFDSDGIVTPGRISILFAAGMPDDAIAANIRNAVNSVADFGVTAIMANADTNRVDLLNAKNVLALSTPLNLTVQILDDVAGSGLLTESEPNSTQFTAQSIDGRWSLTADPNIGDATNTNTSTTIPHVTVTGTGDGTADFFSFTVGSAGKKGIFDIDFGTAGGVPLDSVITLYDSNGFILATNNDSLLAVLDPGSADVADSFLEYTFATPGTYVLGVVGFGSTGVPSGASYSLHASLESDAIIAEGGATTATVTREGSTVGDLTVALSVPVNGSRVTVPATVTIPDGAASATFTITAVDDDVAGSVQTVIVAGSAAGYTSVTDSMDVTDDDVPTLTVSIAPGTISETDAPGTAVATVTRNTPLDRDLTVTVASMDPSEILFGQSSLGSGVIAEVETNNSLATAQSIDGQWSLRWTRTSGIP